MQGARAGSASSMSPDPLSAKARLARAADDQPFPHRHRKLALWAHERPIVDAVITEAIADATMVAEVVGRLGRAMAFNIGGRPRNDPAHVLRPALGDHVLGHGAAMTDAGIEAFANDIDQSVVRLNDSNILTMIGFYVAFASAIAAGVVYNSARILF